MKEAQISIKVCIISGCHPPAQQKAVTLPPKLFSKKCELMSLLLQPGVVHTGRKVAGMLAEARSGSYTFKCITCVLVAARACALGQTFQLKFYSFFIKEWLQQWNAICTDTHTCTHTCFFFSFDNISLVTTIPHLSERGWGRSQWCGEEEFEADY